MMTNLAENLSDADLYEALLLEEVRSDFWSFRRYMRPNMVVGWFQWDVAQKLQSFYDKLIKGQRPILVIQAPPQHGKSVSVADAIAWMSGRCPYLKFGFASYSEMLGVRTNLFLQRVYDDPRYKKVFPELVIPTRKSNGIRTRDKIEFLGYDGSFRNTTVGGAITGEPLDVGIIDDPIKGRAEANSPTIRDKTWEWFTDDFSTRFSEFSGLLWVMTRWHIDDPVGRFLAQNVGNVEVIRYAAIAEQDEEFRDRGEPLFPEHKSLNFLNEIKSRMASFSYDALYQQNPKVIGGNIIKSAYFMLYRELPLISYRVIYGDTAQKTADANDYTVFQCWGKGMDGGLYLIDQIRGKWDAVDLESRFVGFWNKHNFKENGFDPAGLGRLRCAKIEDKVSGTGLIQKIKREGKIPILPIERTTDKFSRVCDSLGYIESGLIRLPAVAPYLNDFLTECEDFSADDSHKFDDQIDPMLDAIADMIGNERRSIYD